MSGQRAWEQSVSTACHLGQIKKSLRNQNVEATYVLVIWEECWPVWLADFGPGAARIRRALCSSDRAAGACAARCDHVDRAAGQNLDSVSTGKGKAFSRVEKLCR